MRYPSTAFAASIGGDSDRLWEMRIGYSKIDFDGKSMRDSNHDLDFRDD